MPEFRFRKSSYSNPERECVEVATNTPRTIAVRDSKDPDGPILQLTPAAWTAFQLAVSQDGLEATP
ncbi:MULTISPECIES: DUF397 domain-containing protein [Streptomyces]|uniref:DUF397 domain-containing protein n=1 Tax=Streptomyces TaxID=1883 RepID=UPI000B9E0548|nr:DUF397 domain-containing protein [Streptomyces kasugaensis]